MQRKIGGVLCLSAGVLCSLLWLVACQGKESGKPAPVKPTAAKATGPSGTTVTLVLAKNFENIDGSPEGDQVGLHGIFGNFQFPTDMKAGVEYKIGVEAQNSSIGTVMIGLGDYERKTWLGQVEFARQDDAFSWEEITVKPQTDVTRIRVAMVNAYSGPDGTLRAIVKRVRVVRAAEATK